MSTLACLLVVSPILVGCVLAAAVDVVARIHGGWATPTPVVDLALAAGHAARVAMIAIPVALIVGTIRGGRA